MIKVGDELPQGILRTKTATIHELKTGEMFSGKSCSVSFQVFTPTCSAAFTGLKIYIKIL